MEPLADGEDYLCLHCLWQMPLLKFTSFTDNAIHATLASTTPVNKAAALFSYRSGSPYTNLIIEAKYNNRPRLARQLGVRLGTSYMPHGFFDDIDAIIPVPVNIWKKARRGYNQSERIATGIASVTSLKVVDRCLGAKWHSTQTRKSAMKRRENARGVFYVKLPQKWASLRHVLIVDDVITTGSTILECIRVLREAIPSIKVSVMAVGLTRLS